MIFTLKHQAVQMISECKRIVTITDILKYQANGIIILWDYLFGMQQVVKGCTATLWQTQDPNSMILSPSCKLPYDAILGFWNAFEIRLCDTLINFNDLKLLGFGGKFYSKATFDIVLCCHKTSLFSGIFYVDNNYSFYLFSLMYYTWFKHHHMHSGVGHWTWHPWPVNPLNECIFPPLCMSPSHPLSVCFSCLSGGGRDCALIKVSDPAERAGPSEGALLKHFNAHRIC